MIDKLGADNLQVRFTAKLAEVAVSLPCEMTKGLLRIVS